MERDGVGLAAGLVGAVTRGRLTADVRDGGWWCASRCAGALRVARAEEEEWCAARGVAVPVTGSATGFGFALVTACTGALTAATTSPAASLSAGATPDERAGTPPPGSKSSDRQTAAAASEAGRYALVTGTCSFILGAPVGRKNEEASRSTQTVARSILLFQGRAKLLRVSTRRCRFAGAPVGRSLAASHTLCGMHRFPAAVLALGTAAVLCGIGLAGASRGAAQQASPACSSTGLAVWSPDKAQIAFVGRRLHHGPLPVRAICVANAGGKNAAPLPHTICTRTCRLDLIDSSTQLYWVSPNLLLYGDNFRIFTIPVGGTPEPLGKQPGSFEQFSVDSAGDRAAAGSTLCPQPQCTGPVTVLGVPSGAVVGRVGGKKLDNVTPSLSPDGKQVVFVRLHPGDYSFRSLGIWTASADGSRLRRLERAGESPLWSPGGAKIAYLRGKAPNPPALLLVSPQGGKSTTLVRAGVIALFGWSPDGSRIAFENAHQRLQVVDVATGKARSLLKLHFGPSVAWSPDSQELLVRTQPLRKNQCADLWRVPAGGGKPQLLRRC